jgi:YNFM family putative membrane transporter
VIYGLWSICGVTGFMVVSTIGILLPAISLELHLSPSQQGMVSSAAFWGSFALAIPLSWWTSRYDPKTLSTITPALGVTFLLIQGWAPVFAVLLFGRLAFGITFLAREPSRAILMQQWFQPREIILANGVSNALFGIVVGGGFLVTPFMLDMLGDDWRATVLVVKS